MQYKLKSENIQRINSVKPERPSTENPIFVGRNWFDGIVDLCSQCIGDHMTAIVVDEEIMRIYPELIQQFRDTLPRVRVREISGGENAKTIQTFSQLQYFLLQSEFHRDDCLISIGGGAVSDVTGFVASTYARGVKWISIPTTFTASFDSAVGGKTALNLDDNKNLCGTFYEPTVVMIDTEFSHRLSDKHFSYGISDMAKLALIGDQPLFDKLSDLTSGGKGANGLKDNLEELIIDAMKVKLAVYKKDPYQQAVRMVFLMGNTTAHALEGASKMRMHHGEALSIGLAFESFMAEKRGMMTSAERKKLVDLLENCMLPTTLPAELKDRDLIEHMHREKRNRGRMISMLLPCAPGHAINNWEDQKLMLKPDELWEDLMAYRLVSG